MSTSEHVRAPRGGFVVLALALAAVVLASAAVPRDAQVQLRALAATGAVAIANSADGSAILHASNMRPGDSASGTVTLTNTGGAAGLLTLDVAAPPALRGPRGGVLPDALQLRVDDVTAGTRVYGGSATGAARVAAGALAPGASRTFAVTVTLPAAASDAYQGASASLDLGWSMTDASAQAPAATAPADGVAVGSQAQGDRLMVGPFRARVTPHGLVVTGRAGCAGAPCTLRTWGWISIGRKWVGWGMRGAAGRSDSGRVTAVRVATSRRALHVLRRALRHRHRVVARIFVRVISPTGATWLVRRNIRVVACARGGRRDVCLTRRQLR